MGLITPAPVAIPWTSSLEVLGGGTGTLLGANDHAPAITVVAGIDLVNAELIENSHALVRHINPSTGTVFLYQAFVYATSQGAFSWRGELPVYTNDSVDVFAVVGNWHCHAWGAVIPGPQQNV
jgi:hypothetical protein